MTKSEYSPPNISFFKRLDSNGDFNQPYEKEVSRDELRLEADMTQDTGGAPSPLGRIKSFSVT